MEINEIINYLRELQAELEPFTHAVNSGELVWDGKQYARAEKKALDVFAFNWWNTIRVAADLLEAQGDSLSIKQLKYIEAMICGGMGSLADYQIDEDRWGENAKNANEKIHKIRGSLYRILQLIK